MSAAADIGCRIRDRRLEAGLTQAELADRAQVSRALIGALERGRHMPATDAAIRLARELDTTVERLFGDTPAPPTLDVVPVLGGALADGALVRAARIDERVVVRVVDSASALSSTGAPADGIALAGRLRLF